MGFIEILRNDEEIKALRKEWEQKEKEPFPTFNHDEYTSIADYKTKIREKMKKK